MLQSSAIGQKLVSGDPASRLSRFAAVGLVNTAVDIGTYLGLRAVGLPLFTANLTSTSLGFVTGFVMHNRFTFGFKATNRQPGLGWRSLRRRLLPYAAVTLTGLWLLQPLVMSLSEWLLAASGLYNLLSATVFGVRLVGILPKLIAVATTMVWNYGWYSRYVFIKTPCTARSPSYD